mmetsp:Transcript_6602/g.20933  ORF Transcript_6602/g.20933 Transcript_6602/m.20933 type:complete len:111 (+) Transcript_6602:523-855(+)
MGTSYSLLALPQWYAEGCKHYGKAGFQRASALWADKSLDVDLSGRVFACTGANSGIGKEVCLALARRRATVHMLCRDQERGEVARSEIVEQTGNENVTLHVVDGSSGIPT